MSRNCKRMALSTIINTIYILMVVVVSRNSVTASEHDGGTLVSRLGKHGDEDGQCERGDAGCSPPTHATRLHRLPGGQVNHVEILTLKSGIQISMKTVSVKPLVFEIEDFLSEEESNHFIKEAQKIGLQQSETISTKQGSGGIVLRDENADKKLSLNEMRLTIEDSFDVYPDLDDIKKMYTDLDIDTNNDEIITPQELGKITPDDIKQYVVDLVKKSPHKHSRYSKQVWLFPDQSTDQVFIDIQERIAELTKLPRSLIKKSDFQVVNYGVDGHYNAHHDSNARNVKMPCCSRHQQIMMNCRLCRYMTVLFYLNDVQSGGGTAFPLAGNASYNEQDFRISGNINLHNHCDKANLVVQPKRGKAVIWYNHFVDEDTGWLGELDPFTWHGGCSVTKGTKWIANFWIKTTDDKKKDLD